ncbi:MAG: trigger factor [Gallionella sp.]|nr:trigger factor [Gallionella sp.]MDD4959921.1 trigger factor [Gallionella sp.]
MSSVETVSVLERRLSASIPQSSLGGEIAARLKKIGRTAKISGFRPGKVPMNLLEKYYGAEVRQEVLGEALQRSFGEAVEAHKLNVAGQASFEVTAYTADAVEYNATFEVYPEVTIGDVAAQSVKRTVYELADSDVENTIATLRKQRAVFVSVARAAQDQDKVTVDFSGVLEGVVFEGGEATDYPVQLGQGRMLPEFEAAIIGMNIGESKSFDMTFPEDYHGKDVAGKLVTFTIKLNKVEAAQLPELDAEFVKSIGIEDGDVSKLEGEIRSNLQRELNRRLKFINKKAAMDALLAATALEVPKAVVEWEAESLMEQTVRNMSERGVSTQGMKLPVEMFKEEATRRVQLGLILQKLVEQHNLTGTDEQAKSHITDYAQSFDNPEQVIEWYLSNPEQMREVKDVVTEENVTAWVMSQAQVTDQVGEFSELMGNN